MRHTEDEIIVTHEINTGKYTFRFEEHWEEDDSGYCCVDYILAKHTSLAVYKSADLSDRTCTEGASAAGTIHSGSPVKRFDFDSREYEKNMTMENSLIHVTYHPEYNETSEIKIDPETLEIVSETRSPF